MRIAKRSMRIAKSALLYDEHGRACVVVSEAARRRGISRQAIAKAIKAQRLEAVAIAGILAVPIDALTEFRPDRARAQRAKAAV